MSDCIPGCDIVTNFSLLLSLVTNIVAYIGAVFMLEK